MEEGAGDWPGNRTRIHSQNVQYNTSSLFNNVLTAAVGLSSQNLPRNHRPMSLNRAQEEGTRIVRNNISSVINELGPLMNHARVAETHGLDLRSWLRQGHPSELQTSNTAVIDTDSTIINLDRISQPSTSQDVGILPSSYSQPMSEAEIVTNSTSVNMGSDTGLHPTRPSRDPTPSDMTAPQAQSAERAPETHSLVIFLQKYVPFIVILLGKAIYDHRAGILIFLGLLVTFTHADSVVRREVAKQSRRSIVSLAFLSLNLFVCICFVYYVFEDQHLYKCLVFIAPYEEPLSLWDLLWIVGITDFVLKFITILLKLSMAAFPGWLLPFSSRGKYYLLLECISQLYRGVAPIQPWLYYLLESYQGPEKVIGVFLSAAYMVSKGTDLMSKVKLFNRAFWKLLQNVSLGVSPNKEQLDTAGSQCPICHDEYNTPVLLHCRHVFCEACVTTWFDREQTCPLCRAKVADDPSWRDGATTFFAQLF